MKSSVKIALIVLTFYANSLVVAEERGPSFDCNRAQRADEIAICKSEKLSQLDRIAADGFKWVKTNIGKPRAEKIARLFLKRRGDCYGSSSCIADVQLEAIETYRKLGAPVSAPQLGSVSDNLQSFVIKGRCHMDYCSFSLILGLNEIKSSRSGSLIEVKARGEQVKAPIVNDETRYDLVVVPEFRGDEGKLWVFCSTSKPTIITLNGEQGGYSVDVISPGFSESMYGYNTWAHLYYWGICHNELLDEMQVGEPEMEVKARNLGYRRLGEDKEGQFEFRTRQQLYQFLGL